MPGKVVSKEEWLTLRKDLLAKEKAALRASEELHSQLRDFPIVKINKAYTFEGPDGKVSTADLFNDNKQLIVYHFMLAPDDEAGCVGCSFLADHLPTYLNHLNSRDTTLVVVSRAPFSKIDKFKKRMGWTFPWYSSFECDFNYDFQATLDSDITPPMFNFELIDAKKKGERPGLSVFYKEGEEIFHTYSSYSRGLEGILVTYNLLDLTPLGRQDPNGYAMQWKLHDEYGVERLNSEDDK